jgi:hypothetical protein
MRNIRKSFHISNSVPFQWYWCLRLQYESPQLRSHLSYVFHHRHWIRDSIFHEFTLFQTQRNWNVGNHRRKGFSTQICLTSSSRMVGSSTKQRKKATIFSSNCPPFYPSQDCSKRFLIRYGFYSWFITINSWCFHSLTWIHSKIPRSVLSKMWNVQQSQFNIEEELTSRDFRWFENLSLTLCSIVCVPEIFTKMIAKICDEKCPIFHYRSVRK